MDSLSLRTKVITEINLFPEDKLAELYHFIHYFRLGVEISQVSPNPTMQFAGCWYNNAEINTRRQQAFLGRRSDEASID